MKDTDALSSNPSAPRRPGARPSVTALLAHGFNASRESVRVLAGLGVLVVAAVVVINVTVWHNVSHRTETEAWRRLESAADVRVSDIDRVLDVIRREASSVARDPYIISAVRSVRAGAGLVESSPLLDELYSRSAEFEFRNVAVLDEQGATIGEWHPRSLEQTELDREAAKAAVSAGIPAWSCPHYGKTAIAVPVEIGRAHV